MSKADDETTGDIIFDILSIDKIGERADLSTTRGARTVEATGSRRALNSSEHVEVSVGQITGWIYRPTLTAAIVLKATASTIPTRTETETDLRDAAFMLSLVPDPIAAASNMTRSDRTQLRALSALLNPSHQAWRSLGNERARLGQTTLDLMLAPGI
jgi:hypothetical protein